MPVREGPAQKPPPPKDDHPPYPAEQARGAETILQRPWQRPFSLAASSAPRSWACCSC